jgi:hypothetical protein
MVLYIISKREGLPSFQDYYILGDDIVITNPVLADGYKKFMEDTLKVSISYSKTFRSDYFFEFAKRVC